MISQEQFNQDTKDHVLTILKEDGVYRHIFVGKPGTSMESFNIVTTPGYLHYYGDMGDFTFSRIDDMLKFFWSKDYNGINPHYWAEKCYSGITKKWSIEKFRRNVQEWTSDWVPSENPNSYDSWEYHVYSMIHAEDEYEAVMAVRNFSHKRYNFWDFWETSSDEYTDRFIWCCYALAWTAGEYFKMKGQ